MIISQTDLMVIANSMESGLCFMITTQQMRKLAEGSLRSAFDGPARRDDILEFVRQTEQNWDVTWIEDPVRGSWTMRKNGEEMTDPLVDRMEKFFESLWPSDNPMPTYDEAVQPLISRPKKC